MEGLGEGGVHGEKRRRRQHGLGCFTGPRSPQDRTLSRPQPRGRGRSLLLASGQPADLAAGRGGLAGGVRGGADPPLSSGFGAQLRCLGAIHAHHLGETPAPTVLSIVSSLLFGDLSWYCEILSVDDVILNVKLSDFIRISQSVCGHKWNLNSEVNSLFNMPYYLFTQQYQIKLLSKYRFN